METKRAMMFQKLELNKKMRQVMKDEEVELFRCIRDKFEHRVLGDPDSFDQALEEVRSKVVFINALRKHTGPLLHLDVFQPTPICSGWITVKHAGRKAQASMRVVLKKGDVAV